MLCVMLMLVSLLFANRESRLAEVTHVLAEARAAQLETEQKKVADLLTATTRRAKEAEAAQQVVDDLEARLAYCKNQ